MSMGGFLALNLAARYPDLVLSAFASGCAPLEGAAKWMTEHPSVFWYLSYSMDVLPESVYVWQSKKQGLLPHKELYDEVFKNKRWELVNDVTPSMAERGWDDVKAVKGVRTLALAGAKKDPVEIVKRMGVVWRENGNVGSKAVKIEAATHAWDLQFPELFAESITAWIEEKPLPEELVEL